MAVAQNSRYLSVNVVKVVDPNTGLLKKRPFMDLRQRVTSFDPTDTQVTADASHRWDTLSDARLGDGLHWWAIADMSGIVDPFDDLAPGRPLRVPSLQRLLFNILAAQNTNGQR